MIRVLIVDDAPLTLSNIERLLTAEPEMEACGTASDAQSALEKVEELRPDVVLVDMDLPLTDGLRATTAIVRASPATAVILMGLDDDEQTLQTALDAGASEYLVKPFGGSELLAAIRGLRQREPIDQPAELQEEPVPPPNASPPAPSGFAGLASLTGAAPIPSPSMLAQTVAPQRTVLPPTAPIPPPPPPPMAAPPPTAASPPVAPPAPPAARPMAPAPRPRPDRATRNVTGHQVVVMLAGKGGVGTSVLATNLGLMVASEGRRRTAIVDLDLQHGDIYQLLRIPPTPGKHILEVAAESPNADPHALIPRIVDGPAGIMALLAPVNPRLPVSLDPAFVDPLFGAMRDLCDLVVVDLPSHLTATSAAALRAADRIVLVCAMSEPGVRSTQSALQTLHGLRVAPERILLLLNRNEANTDLTRAAVEEALGMEATVQLPYDPILISSSINRGAPFALQQPDAQVSRRLRDLAALLVQMPHSPDGDSDRETPTPGPPRPPTADDDEGGRRRGRRGLFGFARP